MPKIPKCDRCSFYAHDSHLICAVHPEGVDSDCLDFEYSDKPLTKNIPYRRTQETLDEFPLKPCPNCGSEGHFFRLTLNDETGSTQFRFDCPNCGYDPLLDVARKITEDVCRFEEQLSRNNTH